MTPADYGLDFRDFRSMQVRALARTRRAFESARIVGLQAGTGFGKSRYAQALAIEASAAALRSGSGAGRTAILTGTHPLADQYGADLASYDHDAAGALEFTDIRGRNNYPCPESRTCEDGRYRRCSLQRGDDPACEYVSTFNRALDLSIVTNFRYFLEIARRTGALGAFDRLIVDEAHHLLDILTSAAAVTLTPAELRDLAISGKPKTLGEWRNLAAYRLPGLQESLAAARKTHSVRDVRRMESYVDRFERLSGVDEEWALDVDDRTGVLRFEPVDVARYAGWFLDAADEVVLMSATLRPMTLELLGLQPPDYKLIEMGSDFSPDDAPVYCHPIVQVRYTMTESDKRVLFSAINQFLLDRPTRKGVIHTISYDRARELVSASPHRERMILHERGGSNISAAVRKFKEAPADSGVVLVSPTVDTGYDFPADAASWQIILKLPWADSRGSKNLVAARKERFPLYAEFGVCQKLEQMAGRINRGKGERAETIIFDKMAQWFVPKYGARGLFTPHFMKRWRFVDGPFPPRPMEL